ncbi:F-box protein At5g07670 [Linum grandiflorum]
MFSPKKKNEDGVPLTWPELWLKAGGGKPLNHLNVAMQFQSPSLSGGSSSPSCSLSEPASPAFSETKTLIGITSKAIDFTLLLNDETLLKILSLLPDSQRNCNRLVCKRWLNLQGRLFRSLRILDWEFLESGVLTCRFPNLTDVDLVNASVLVAPVGSSTVCLTHRLITSANLNSGISVFSSSSPDHWRVCDDSLLPAEVVDKGLKVLANGCPNLRRLAVNNASDLGLLNIAEECSTLQELELHRCSDSVLQGISACTNLQILKIVGNVYGLYSSLVSDVGLTILAQGCKRLVKLELSGCEGSYDGVKAIGQCCQMLEELTVCDHKMDDGWLAALQFCENLKSLKLMSCNSIDSVPGPDEYLGSCSALETLQMERCQLRDVNGVRALFTVCEAARDITIRDCWGLSDEVFSFANICRRVEQLDLEHCSVLTTEGLESVLLTWSELENLKIESCKKINDGDISPALSNLFCNLKELRWRPDSKSILAAGLTGTGIGEKGSKFFRKS